MRFSEIKKHKPGTFFATCDGNMVRPVQPLSDKYYRASGEQWLIASPGEERDPWARCSGGKKPKHLGVLVEVFNFDATGKADGKPIGRMIYKSRDIGGTWDDFVLLHGDKVVRRAETRLGALKALADGEALKKRFDKTGFKFPVGEIARWQDGDIRPYASHWESSRVEVRMNGTNWGQTPIEQTWPRHVPEVFLRARNAEDVEYLLRVMEAGVKAVRKAEARKAARAAVKQEA